MKKLNNCYIILFLGIFTFLQGCKKEDSNRIIEELTTQVKKIETSYYEGAVKNEFLYSFGVKKVEVIEDAFILAELEKASDSRLYKRNTLLKKYGYNSAVLKSGNCRTADLQITLDTEDSGNESEINGWAGDSYLDSKGNVVLKLCACNVSDFTNLSTQENYNRDFAILQIDWVDVIDQVNIQQIFRRFDCEDTNNANAASFSGNNVKNTNNILPTSVTDNANFAFLMFPAKINGATSMPYLTIADNYGVFGYFKEHPWYPTGGYIFTDDEDTKNRNSLTYNGVSVAKVDCIIQGGINTKMYVTQVTNGVIQ